MTTMLRADELDAMRAQQVRAMPGVATLLERSTTRDAGGGRRAGYTARSWARPSWAPAQEWPAAPGIPARLGRPAHAELALAGAQYAGRPGWVLTLPWGAPVAELDHVRLAADPTPLELEVVGILSGPTSWGTALRLTVVAAPSSPAPAEPAP